MRTLNIPFRQQTLALGAAIQRRRATPHFKPDPVPEALLQELLELATLAPSGYNLQPWRFIVVRDPANRKKLREAAFGQSKVEEAPVVVIACGDPQAWREDIEEMLRIGKEAGAIYNERMAAGMRQSATDYLSSTDLDIWVTRQTLIAFTHLLLAAECYGLDTAPMEGFDEAKVRAAFGIPERVRVLALLAIGYGREPDKPYGGRFELSRVVFAEHFGDPWDGSR